MQQETQNNNDHYSQKNTQEKNKNRIINTKTNPSSIREEPTNNNKIYSKQTNI